MEGRWDSIMCRYLFGIGLIQAKLSVPAASPIAVLSAGILYTWF